MGQRRIYLVLCALFVVYLALSARPLFLGPRLSLPYASDSIVFSETTFTLTGSTEPFSLVFVNGQEASVGPDGSFSFTFSLIPGVNPVEVVAQNEFGKKSTERLRIIVGS